MLEKFERYPLTFGPTPIEKLSRLSEHLGGAVEIYAKRLVDEGVLEPSEVEEISRECKARLDEAFAAGAATCVILYPFLGL